MSNQQVFYKVEYLTLEIVTGAGNILKLTNSEIGQIELYESLEIPGITGSISVIDFRGILELYNVSAGDTFKFSWKTPKSQTISSSYTITKVILNDFPPDDFVNNHVRFEFCSTWYLNGITKIYSNLWKNQSLDKICSNLISYCGGNIGTVEPSNITLEHFGSPYWNPVKILYYLIGFYGNGILMFPDISTDNVNFVSLDTIFSSGYGTYKPKFVMYPENQNYEALVYNMTVEQITNIEDYAGNGLGGLNFTGFNFDQQNFQTPSPFYATPQQVPFSNIATVGTLSNKFQGGDYVNNQQLSIFPQTKNPVSQSFLNNIISNIQNSYYLKLLADAVKLNILTNGSSDRKIGQVCNIEVPSLKNNKSEGDKNLSGQYVISSIKRVFRLSTVKELISCINTGTFKSNNPNLIKLKNV